MTYQISFDISFASDYTSDSLFTAIFSVFTAGKGKNIRSVTVTLIHPWSRVCPLQKKKKIKWILDY